MATVRDANHRQLEEPMLTCNHGNGAEPTHSKANWPHPMTPVAGSGTGSKEPRPGAVRRLLRQFCETSSMRSVPRIVRAPTGVQRLLWVCALLAGASMTSYQLYKLLGMYFSYRTSINMVHVKNAAPFPDVTVCNLNPLWVAHSSRLNVTWTYEDYLAKLQDFFASGDHISAENSYLFDSLQTYEGYLQYFSQEDLNQVQDHLVWDCRWEYGEGMPPSTCWEDLGRHVSPYYGPCTTFHIQQPSAIFGQPSRLIMMLFVNDFAQGEIKDFFLSSYYTYSSGVRLLVHPCGTFPLMDEGVNLPPGHESTIKAHATHRQLMSQPYGVCAQTDIMDTRYQSEDERYTYTDRVCSKFCVQDYIIDSCGCVDPYTPFPKSYRGLEQGFCGLLDFDNHRSVNKTLQHLDCLAQLAMDNVCDCPQPCSHHLYDIEVSQVPWPHVNYHMAFYHKYIAGSSFEDNFGAYAGIERKMAEDKDAGFEQLRQTDLIRRNFLEISVILDSEQTTMMEDYPVLSLESLFGNVGGILNMWVGISFVTAVEIMDLVWTCMSSKKNRSLIRAPGATGGGQGNAQ